MQQHSSVFVFQNLLKELEDEFQKQVKRNQVLQEEHDFFRRQVAPAWSTNESADADSITLEANLPVDALERDLISETEEQCPMEDKQFTEDLIDQTELSRTLDKINLDLDFADVEPGHGHYTSYFSLGSGKASDCSEIGRGSDCSDAVAAQSVPPVSSHRRTVDFKLADDEVKYRSSLDSGYDGRSSLDSGSDDRSSNGRRTVDFKFADGELNHRLSLDSGSDGRSSDQVRQQSVVSRGTVTRFASGSEAVRGVFPAWFNPKAGGRTVSALQRSSPSVYMQNHFDTKPKRDSFMLSPLGGLRLSWDICWCIALIFECFITPIDLVFIETGSLPEAWVVITYVTLTIFCIDIILSFFTGYIVEGKEILERPKVIRTYLRTWFCFDILVTIPWDELVSSVSENESDDSAGISNTARASKAFRAQKLFKLLRFVKVVKQFNAAKQARKARMVNELMKSQDSKPPGEIVASWLAQTLQPLKVLSTPLQICCFLLLMSHFHGSMWAWLRDDWQPTADIDLAFERYLESLWWAFSIFTFGEPPTGTTLIIQAFDLLMLSERLVMVFLASLHVVFQAMMKYEDSGSLTLHCKYAMEYLKSRHIDTKTQILMQFSVNETVAMRKRLSHFEKIMQDAIPQNLQRQVRQQLWSDSLRSLGLFQVIDDWDPHIVPKICQHIHEETYAPQVILFREGDAGGESYFILSGIVWIFNLQEDNLPLFTQDMWLGERSLINPSLRRSATGIIQSTTSLMVVPAAIVHGLLEKHGILNTYLDFCSTELWKGLCGRCGLLGDHFGDECPDLGLARRNKEDAKSGLTGSLTRTFTRGLTFTFPDSDKPDVRRRSVKCERDLKLYIQMHQLEKIYPVLHKLEVWNLNMVAERSSELVEDAARQSETRLTDHEAKLLKPDTLMSFFDSMVSNTKKTLLKRVDAGQHFIFLSHFKAEAGTEASLMRAEFEALIMEDAGHEARTLDAPVFLDSEDLSDLGQLCNSVAHSHNIVILLTRGILTRPWCVVEIATALQHDVALVPVKISKPTADDFQFPDEQYYKDMSAGKILGKEGTEVVTNEGFDMEFVNEAIRSVFKHIALPYSPHKSAAIRKTELRAIFKQCVVRRIESKSLRKVAGSQ